MKNFPNIIIFIGKKLSRNQVFLLVQTKNKINTNIAKQSKIKSKTYVKPLDSLNRIIYMNYKLLVIILQIKSQSITKNLINHLNNYPSHKIHSNKMNKHIFSYNTKINSFSSHYKLIQIHKNIIKQMPNYLGYSRSAKTNLVTSVNII